MRKIGYLIIISVMLLLPACGGVDNKNVMDAAKTFMTAMVEGDMELMSEINHSDGWNFPADHMITIANRDGVVGMDLSDMEFEQIDDRMVEVTFTTNQGEDGYTLVFNEEKDGYYFIELD